MGTILQDPKGMAGADFEMMADKIKVAQMILARSCRVGGSPFVFCFASTKPHSLEDIKVEIYEDDEGHKEFYPTAATNGKEYFWHPEVLKKRSPQSIAITQMHETFHVVFQHCDRNRTISKNPKIWNIAVDYVVNSIIEHDFRKSGYISDSHSAGEGQEHPIWNGELGKPLYLKDLIGAMKKEVEDLKKGRLKKSVNKKSVYKKPRDEDMRRYVDYNQHGRSAEEIYEEIMAVAKDLTDEMLNQLLAGLGAGTGDEHMPVEISREELLQQVLKGLQHAQLMGNTPSGVDDVLAKLSEPQLSWQDFCRATFHNIRRDKGNVNDWSRFKRRFVSYGLYSPKKKDFYLNFYVVVDTSGSMSSDDLSFGISQLKALDGRAQGTVVCCDTECYWSEAQNIYTMDQLPTIKIVGRGGTMMGPFFNNIHKHIKGKIDLLIYLGDSWIFDLNEIKNPGIETVWVQTAHNPEFKPHFGRVLPLRAY